MNNISVISQPNQTQAGKNDPSYNSATAYSSNKTIGSLLIAGSILLLIPYTILSITFDYPAILRQDTGQILSTFYKGGSSLLFTWWCFAIVGLPLLGAYILIGQKLEHKISFVRLATQVGVIGLIVQIIGLLRWTFVVPVLAESFVNGNEITRQANITAFQVIHQFGGVLLGEHLGQLFTIAWTVMMTLAFYRLKLFPVWVHILAYTASAIYLLAQAELFATVIPGFPAFDLAGFVGSTLWLVWLICIGIQFLCLKADQSQQ